MKFIGFILSIAAVIGVSRLSRSDDRETDQGAQPLKAFAINIHIATMTPLDSDQRVKIFVDTANEHFKTAGILFAELKRTILPGSFAILETQRERHLLKKHFVPNTINVFLVDEIQDPTPSAATKKAAAWQGCKPSGHLAGAVIEFKNKKPGIYIILSRNSSKLTLAHELGHLFRCAHSKDPRNIMSYGSERMYFSEKQIKTFQATAKRFGKNHILKSCEAGQIGSLPSAGDPSVSGDKAR